MPILIAVFCIVTVSLFLLQTAASEAFKAEAEEKHQPGHSGSFTEILLNYQKGYLYIPIIDDLIFTFACLIYLPQKISQDKTTRILCNLLAILFIVFICLIVMLYFYYQPI